MPEIRVYALMHRQDDPRKCTAARLLRAGEIKLARSIAKIPRGAVVLDPEAEKAVSRETSTRLSSTACSSSTAPGTASTGSRR